MALNVCQNCTTAYALDLQACPHCRQPAAVVVSDPLAPAVRTVEAEPAKRRARREQPASDAGTVDSDDRG